MIKWVSILFLGLLSVSAHSQPEGIDSQVEMQGGDVSMEAFIDFLSEEAGVLFSYSSQQIQATRTIHLPKGKKSVREILHWLEQEYGVDSRMIENQLILKRAGDRKAVNLNEQLHTISGFLYDDSTGETLIGATVFASGTEHGTASNAFGYYSISLPEGKYELSYSYLGYENRKAYVHLKENITQSMALKPERILLPAVLIQTGIRQTLTGGSQMSQLDFRPEQLNKLPEFAGESGLIKGLQTLPGIKTHSDGSAFFFVRGGDKDQNLIIIDDATVYNPSHLFGYYSMVIPDFTKDIRVYKSDMPVHLGDRLSSIVDIRTRDGNLNHFHLTGMLNPLVSRFSLEGPIVKDKSSFFTSLRTSNIQWIYKSFVPNLDFRFSDFNVKWNYKPNNRNRIFFTYFLGADDLLNRVSETSYSGIRWNNMATSLRVNRVVNPAMFMNVSLIGSIYQYTLDLEGNRWRSNIASLSLKSDVHYYPRPDITIQYGFNLSNYAFDPGSLTLGGVTRFLPTISSGKSVESVLYGRISHRLNQKWRYSAGFRMPLWNNTGPTTLYLYSEDYSLIDTVAISNNKSYKSFLHFDPRLSLSYSIDSSRSVKFSYGAYHQYIHLLSNSTSPFTSIEVWLPSGLNIKPQRADQLALGYYHSFGESDLHFSLEGYFKNMQNQIDYEPHADMLINPLVEGELRYGRARAYGMEWFLEKKYGRLNGWASYTWSRVFLKTPGINEGNTYRAFRDRPHDISLFLNYELTPRLLLSGNWNWYTGSPVTLPIGFYAYNDTTIPLYGEKNNARLPDYHRLDLALRYILNKPGSRYKHSLSFSLYNVYGRKNPVSVNYNRIQKDQRLVVPADLFGMEGLVYSQRDLLRVMPSISYKFEL